MDIDMVNRFLHFFFCFAIVFCSFFETRNWTRKYFISHMNRKWITYIGLSCTFLFEKKMPWIFFALAFFEENEMINTTFHLFSNWIEVENTDFIPNLSYHIWIESKYHRTSMHIFVWKINPYNFFVLAHFYKK